MSAKANSAGIAIVAVALCYLLLALCVPTSVSGQGPNQTTIQIKDKGEFDAYSKATSSQGSPTERAAALESFLRAYPQSPAKKVVLVALLHTYLDLKDRVNALITAKRGLQVDPNDRLFIYVAVRTEIDECNRTGDATTCNDAAALGQRGLSVPKPPDFTDENWSKEIALTYPSYRLAVTLAKPEPPDTTKMTNNEVIQLVTAGLSDQVVTNSIRQASSKGFDLSTVGLLGLKKAGVSDAVIAIMQESGPSAQGAPGSDAPPSPAPAPTPTPDNGCSDIDFMGVFQTQASPTGGLWIYVATIRNRATYTKEVDLEYVKNGQSAKGTFSVRAGEKINAQLDLNSSPPTNVHMTACR